MKIIPAIDIKDGKCTQLVGGKAQTAKYYGSPLDSAKKWVELGAEVLHIVDLDAALGAGNNLDNLLQIRDAVDVPIHFGGGVRDYEYCLKLLKEYKIERVAIGTLAMKDLQTELNGGKMQLRSVPKELRERIIISIDSKGGKVVTNGWQNATGIPATDVAKKFSGLTWGFLYTDVDVEGQMRGINLARTKDVVNATKNPVIASGGVSSMKDIDALVKAGAWGVVLGKALYEGKFNVEKLFLKK